MNKLCIGTVQFGLPYGIAGRKEKISKENAFAILNYAYNAGITTVDTARFYGESEKIIGKFKQAANRSLSIISKPPPLETSDHNAIEKYFYDSLNNLMVKDIYGYLIHKFSDFLEYSKTWDILEQLKKEKVVKKIGFSLYTPQQLEILLEKKITFNIIQVPYSVFDRRFENYFKILKANNVEVHVRSVFLQGLVFLDPDSLSENLIKAKNCIKRLRYLALRHNISINSICLNFALLNPNIDKVVVGVDSLDHLKENLISANSIKNVRNIYNKLDQLIVKNEDILLPYKWAKS